MKKILANIIPKLQKRFNLQTIGAVEDLVMGDIIQPVTQVDTLLREPLILEKITAQTVTGSRDMYSVPTGKRFILKAVQVTAVSGTITISSIHLHDPISDNSISIHILDTPVTNVAVQTNDMVLRENWAVGAYITVTEAGNVNIAILVEQEDEYK